MLGVFMKVLSGDQTIDPPKDGWKPYTVRYENTGAVVAVPAA
jgi:hypothetical protein